MVERSTLTSFCHAPAGHWQHDKRHGFGRCKFVDGTRFAGRWEDDGWVQSAADAARSGIPPECLPLRATAGHDCCFTLQVHDRPRRVYWQLEHETRDTYCEHNNCRHMPGNATMLRMVMGQERLVTKPSEADVISMCRRGTTLATSASRGAMKLSLSCGDHRPCMPPLMTLATAHIASH